MLMHYFSDPVMLDLIQQMPDPVDFPGLDVELSGNGYRFPFPPLDPAGVPRPRKSRRPSWLWAAAQFRPGRLSMRRRRPILTRGSSLAAARCTPSISRQQI
jgi:hypothetical protein